MKLLVTKNQLTYNDVTPTDFPLKYNVGLLSARNLHNAYNRLLQYYTIKLLFDAVNASIGQCHCFDGENSPETCITNCTAKPTQEQVDQYLEDNKENTRSMIRIHFEQVLKLIQLGCDNSCNTYQDVDFTTLVFPKLECLCPDNALDYLFPEITIEDLQEHILTITEYLDYFELTEHDIENMQYFSVIKYINEQDNTQYPDELIFSGYYEDGDNGRGVYYIDRDDVLTANDNGIVYCIKGIRYKRPVTDKVYSAWFGLDQEYNETEVNLLNRSLLTSSEAFQKLVAYQVVYFNSPEINITLQEIVILTISDSLLWSGYSVINITLENTLTTIFRLKLLNDIYCLRIEGLIFNIIGTATNLFQLANTFKPEITIFEATSNITTGIDTISYTTQSQTEYNGYLEFLTLPIVPDITDTTDTNQIINYKYLNSVVRDDKIVDINSSFVITGQTTFTQEVLTNVDSKVALTLSKVNSELPQLITDYIQEAKDYVQGLSVSLQYPIGSYYIQLACLGYFNNDGTYNENHEGTINEIFHDAQIPANLFPGTTWERVAVEDNTYLAAYSETETTLNSVGIGQTIFDYKVDNSQAESGIMATNNIAATTEFQPRSRKCIIWKRTA